jgi:hypothetical protein
VCGVGIEEAASVGSQELDSLLRGHGPQRDDLLTSLKSMGNDIGAKGLNYPLRGK